MGRDLDGGIIYGGTLYEGLNEGETFWYGAGAGLTLGASYAKSHTSPGLQQHPYF